MKKNAKCLLTVTLTAAMLVGFGNIPSWAESTNDSASTAQTNTSDIVENTATNDGDITIGVSIGEQMIHLADL